MRVEKDFAEFLELFNKNKVRYLIIGAFAVGFYGYPRYSKDIDILVEPSEKNAKNIVVTLKEFGGVYSNLSESDFEQENKIIQLGYEPVRIDILTSIKGFKFEELWKNKKIGSYGNQKAFFIGLEELIKVKKEANRPQDLVDLEKLAKRKK